MTRVWKYHAAPNQANYSSRILPRGFLLEDEIRVEVISSEGVVNIRARVVDFEVATSKITIALSADSYNSGWSVGLEFTINKEQRLYEIIKDKQQ